MPFQPQFVITNNILTSVANAEAARQIIDNALLVPHWERKFRNNAIVRSIHHSTAIEGNELGLDETRKIIRGENVSTYRARDVKEIVNYRDVIGFISEIEYKYLTTSLLFEIHQILGKGILPDKYLGSTRKKNAVIINSESGEVVFDAPTAAELDSELDELINWDKQTDLHPLLKAGVMHFELVRIHPFVDLNGRTARIAATWSLYRDGYDIKRFFSLEEYYDQNVTRYYDSLDSAHDGDMTEWLEYFVTGLAEELQRIKEKVLALSRDHQLREKLGQVALNERQIMIINYLEQHQEMRNPDFNEIFPDISDDTVLRDLKDLNEKGIIKKRGRTKGAKYVLS